MLLAQLVRFIVSDVVVKIVFARRKYFGFLTLDAKINVLRVVKLKVKVSSFTHSY